MQGIQVALAWVLHQPFPVLPLVGPANPVELESCVRALDLELSPEEMGWLDLQAERGKTNSTLAITD